MPDLAHTLIRRRYVNVVEVKTGRVTTKLDWAEKVCAEEMKNGWSEERFWRRRRGKGIKERVGFSTGGAIDAILDAATYEQVCYVWRTVTQPPLPAWLHIRLRCIGAGQTERERERGRHQPLRA